MQNESIEAQRLAAEGAEVSDELVKVPLAPGSAGKPKKKPFRQRFKKEILAYSLIGIPLVWWCVFFVVALVGGYFLHKLIAKLYQDVAPHTGSVD